jgi:hypothetical protein
MLEGLVRARGEPLRDVHRDGHHLRPRTTRSRRGAAPSATKIAGLLSRMTPPLLSNSDSRPVEQLGEAIADIAAGIHAATYQLLVLLHEFDERAGWNNGFLSCAHWLSWRTGIDPGAAREKVRVARALPQLPLLSGALQRGEISYAKVRARRESPRPTTRNG